VAVAQPGSNPDIAVDAAGTVHIAFTLGGQLRYTSNISNAWTVESITIPGPFRQIRKVALAVASSGNVHIVYQFLASTGNGFDYVWKTASGAWTFDTIDAGDLGLIDISFAGPCLIPLLTPQAGDCLMVSYYDSGNGHLKYAHKSSTGSWQVEVVDSNVVVQGPTQILGGIGPLPSVHIAYYDANNQAIKHASKVGLSDSWDTETVDSDARGPVYLAAEADELHFIYSAPGPWGESNLSPKHAFHTNVAAFAILRRDTVDGAGIGGWSTLDTVTGTTYEDTSAIQDVLYEYAAEAIYGLLISP
jgi:hypothetical protein